MSKLPPFFSRPWNLDFRIAAWRLELRHSGRDAIPSVPCRLLHFQSGLSDFPKGPDSTRHQISEMVGFVGDSVWSAGEFGSDGARNAKGLPALGYVTAISRRHLNWDIGLADEMEFEKYVQTLERVTHPDRALTASLYGHARMVTEGDRGERYEQAPIMFCSLKIDSGTFTAR